MTGGPNRWAAAANAGADATTNARDAIRIPLNSCHLLPLGAVRVLVPRPHSAREVEPNRSVGDEPRRFPLSVGRIRANVLYPCWSVAKRAFSASSCHIFWFST